MKVKKIKHISRLPIQCDIQTESTNFFIYPKGDKGILAHNSPSLLVASDFHGEAFVGTKGLFAGKVNRTLEDIQEYHGHSEGLAHKLKIFLQYAKEIGVPKNQIWQGDVLYSKDTLSIESQDGEEFVTFHPNTIVYAVPMDDPMAHSLLSSEAGIAWHTRYEGDSLEEMGAAQFNVRKEELNDIPEIISLDANLPSLAGSVTFTQSETDSLNAFVTSIEKAVTSLKQDNFLNEVKDSLLSKYLNMFENYTIKTHMTQLKEDPEDYLELLSEWVTNRYQKELGKSGAKKSARLTTELETISNYIKVNRSKLKALFVVQKVILSFKDVVVEKLDKLGDLRSFVKKTNVPGLFSTGQEGFVVSDEQGNIAKLVSRLEFSKNNFSSEILKGWDSAKRSGVTEALSTDIKDSALNYIASLDLKADNDRVQNKKKTYIDDLPTLGAQVRPVNAEIGRKEKAQEVLDVIDPEDIIEVNIPEGDTRPTIVLNKDSFVLSLEFKDQKGRSIKMTATDTKEMESWWMYFMKAKLDGQPYPSLSETKEGFRKANDSWRQSFISGAEAVFDYVDGDREYFFSREDIQIPESQFPAIHALVDQFFKKKKSLMTGIGKKIDAWNPSDIYLCHKTYITDFITDWQDLIANPDSTVADANTVLGKALEEKLLIGISLKKLTDVENIHVENNKADSGRTMHCEINRAKLSTYLIANSKSGLRAEGTEVAFSVTKPINMQVIIAFRYFGDTVAGKKYGGPLRVEMRHKNSAAQLGKLPSAILNFYLEDLGLELIPEISERRAFADSFTDQAEISKLLKYAQNIEEMLGTVCNVRASEVSTYLTELAELRKTEKTATKEFIKATSIVQGLYFLNILAEAERQGRLNEILSDMLKRAAKTHDVNAPYIKLS